MYDYEMEKSLEERQAEDLELNLERNKRNRKFDRNSRIAYILIAVVFVISIIAGLNKFSSDKVNWFPLYIAIASIISSIILIVARVCPHCRRSLFKMHSYVSDSYNFLELLWTDRCPHCGVSLFPSESLTAIEKRRKGKNREKNLILTKK